jgi:PEP-CTERM motif
MVHKLALAAVLISLGAAREASAISIPATDLDTFMTGPSLGVPSILDTFTVAAPPPDTMGTITNEVFVDDIANPTQYTYTHDVTSDLNNNVLFNTQFEVSGFTGVAGFSFSDAFAAGGLGNAGDFDIDEIGGQLRWVPGDQFGLGAGWDLNEPIRFFYVSTNPPGIGDYNLGSTEVGTAQSYAPIPEPGSIALLGSGLVGLYAAVRRRRNRHV